MAPPQVTIIPSLLTTTWRLLVCQLTVLQKRYNAGLNYAPVTDPASAKRWSCLDNATCFRAFFVEHQSHNTTKTRMDSHYRPSTVSRNLELLMVGNLIDHHRPRNELYFIVPPSQIRATHPQKLLERHPRSRRKRRNLCHGDHCNGKQQVAQIRAAPSKSAKKKQYKPKQVKARQLKAKQAKTRRSKSRRSKSKAWQSKARQNLFTGT